MRQRVTKSVEVLKVERLALLTLFADAKTKYVKDNLAHKIKSVNKDLYTQTKETKYL
jgi:hypothetical protein